MHCKSMTVQTLVILVSQALCHLCLVTNTTKFFQKFNLETKNFFCGLWKSTYHTIFIYGKMPIIEFSYSFLYMWSCMKLYDEEFLKLYDRCFKENILRYQFNRRVFRAGKCGRVLVSNVEVNFFPFFCI